MSKRGIDLVAYLLNDIQNIRYALMDGGTTLAKIQPESGKQDILLGQMLVKMNDAVKDEFTRIVDMSIEPESGRCESCGQKTPYTHWVNGKEVASCSDGCSNRIDAQVQTSTRNP